ncbi:MAG: phage tail protein [Chloroflexota bacterium]|nr:phage tail protein [Chloroflexota bacterium]
MPATGQRIDAFPTAKFGIEIGSIMAAEFTEVTGLEAEVEIFEYQEGGNNLFTHKLPGRVKFPNITLKRGVTDSRDLWDWFQSGIYGQIQRKNMSIMLFDQSGEEAKRWNFVNAYPIKWTGPSFKASDNSISIETLVIVHEGMSPA